MEQELGHRPQPANRRLRDVSTLLPPLQDKVITGNRVAAYRKNRLSFWGETVL